MEGSYELEMSRIDLSGHGDLDLATDTAVLRVEVRGQRCAEHAMAVIQRIASEMKAEPTDRVLVVAAWVLTVVALGLMVGARAGLGLSLVLMAALGTVPILLEQG